MVLVLQKKIEKIIFFRLISKQEIKNPKEKSSMRTTLNTTSTLGWQVAAGMPLVAAICIPSVDSRLFGAGYSSFNQHEKQAGIRGLQNLKIS